MDLSLSPTQQLRLEETTRALLSPLEYPEVDAWRAAVNRGLRELLDADMVSFILPGTGSVGIFSQDIDIPSVNTYPARLKPIDSRYNTWQRQVAFGAWDREALHRPYAAAYFRSAYYNDYIVPIRCHDAIGLTIALGPRVEATSVAGLLCHHNRPTGRSFGERGVALLRLLLPAFRSGVHAYRLLATTRDMLARSLDGIGVALAVCDARTGQRLHVCPALAALLARDPERARLEAELQTSARAAGESGVVWGAPDVMRFRRLERRVTTRAGAYRLRVSQAPSTLGCEDAVLVLLEPCAPALPGDAELAERFGITRMEARVARLLAEGKTNAEVAAALSISPHTAERHTERIFQKLDVHSRAAVGATLLRG